MHLIAQGDQNETHIYSVNQDEIFLSLAQYPAPEPGMASGYVSLMYPVDFQPMPTSMPATQIDRITVCCGRPNSRLRRTKSAGSLFDCPESWQWGGVWASGNRGNFQVNY